MKKRYVDKDIFISIFMYLLVAVIFIQTKKLPRDSAWFPYIILSIFTLLNTFLLFSGIKKSKAPKEDKLIPIDLSQNTENDPEASSNQDEDSINNGDLKTVLKVLVILTIYIALFKYTNYFIATSLMIISLMIFNKVRSWKMIIFTTIIFNIFIYILFVMQLKVPLMAM